MAARYVDGPAGDTALQLTAQSGANGVVLSQAYNTALQAGPDDSFTVQIELKTTDSQGTIIGTRPDIRNWALLVVNGQVQFSVFDGVNTAVITSPAAINDGQWHHIAAVRDAAGRLLHLYVDHVEVTPPVVDTATTPYGQFEHVLADPMYLGAYNSLIASSKLDVTVDTLRFTRAALAPDQFFGANLVSSAPPPPKTYLSNNPTTIPGLQLWLPAYDPAYYFSDFGSFANPLPLTPFVGMSTRSMVEASDNAFQLQTNSPYGHILYGQDSVIGPYWVHQAEPDVLQFGSAWWVHNKTSSATPNSFDFVQNTGVFTMSAFVNVGAATGGYMTIFDTSEGSNSKPGFSLFLQQNGLPFLTVTGGTAETVRFFDSAPAGAVAPSTWYHVAVVGTGPGNPIQFYVTPVSNSTVAEFNSTTTLAGANGTYPTDLNHELFIGSRSNRQSPGAVPFNGGLVNETIYDTALTPAQIQQLFMFGKGLTTVLPPWQNPVNPNDVNDNGKVQASDVAILVSRLLQNLGGTLPAPTPGNAPPPYLDPSGNNTLNAGDVAKVVNWLLTHPPAANPVVAQAAAVQADAAPGAVEPMAAPLAAPDVQPLAATGSVAAENTASPQISPQNTFVAPAVVETTPAKFDVPTSDTAPATVGQSSGASVLLVQPRYSRMSSAARVAPTNCGDDSGAQVAAGIDAYFAALARKDEEGDATESLADGAVGSPSGSGLASNGLRNWPV